MDVKWTCRIIELVLFYIRFYVSVAAQLSVVRDPSGNRLGDIVAVVHQEFYVIAVDKAGLNEDGGHGGLAQDTEVVALLDAAVVIAAVDALQAGDELVLDAGREHPGFARNLVAVGLGAATAARVDMDTDEKVRGPAVGGINDAGPAG